MRYFECFEHTVEPRRNVFKYLSMNHGRATMAMIMGVCNTQTLNLEVGQNDRKAQIQRNIKSWNIIKKSAKIYIVIFTPQTLASTEKKFKSIAMDHLHIVLIIS